MSQVSALLLTLAVEVPLYVAALVSLGLTTFRRALVLAVVANLLTHPVLWWTLGSRPPLLHLVLAEIAVWLAESALTGLALRRNPALILLTAAGTNAASILAGALIAAAS